MQRNPPRERDVRQEKQCAFGAVEARRQAGRRGLTVWKFVKLEWVRKLVARLWTLIADGEPPPRVPNETLDAISSQVNGRVPMF